MGARRLEAEACLALAESLRVEAGSARFGDDYDEKAMPTEVGLGDAVSYAKGCYVGQELLERMRSRGTATKLLRGLVLEEGGAASHVAIVARALDLAAVSQVTAAVDLVETGDPASTMAESPVRRRRR